VPVTNTRIACDVSPVVTFMSTLCLIIVFQSTKFTVPKSSSRFRRYNLYYGIRIKNCVVLRDELFFGDRHRESLCVFSLVFFSPFFPVFSILGVCVCMCVYE